MKKVKWLMDGEVPVETNVTAYKAVFYPMVLVLVTIAVVLVVNFRSVWKSGIVIITFLIFGVLLGSVIWSVCTNFSSEYFNELHRRSD